MGIALAGLAGLPAGAAAATQVSYTGGGFGYTIQEAFRESDGPVNRVSITFRTDVDPDRLEVRDLDAASPRQYFAVEPCTKQSSILVHCPGFHSTGFTTLGGRRPATVVRALLGVGDDRLEERTSADSTLFSDPLFVEADVGNDVVIGGRGGDMLRGGPGDDVLEGGAGADEITDEPAIQAVGLPPTSGRDRFAGGAGADFINSRDGEVDVLPIDCGTQPPLESDSAEIDLVDKTVNCESVDRFAVDDGPPGRPVSTRLRVRRNGRSRIRIACPRKAKIRCRGRLRVRDPRRRARVLASASYNVRRGRRKSVVVRLTAGERRLLLRRRRALLTTREQGLSRKGPRSAERIARVAS